MLTFGSLFAGIGGFDLGLERAGMKTVWQVEIDPFCRKVLEKHWPNIPKYGDVQKFCRRAYDCGPENEEGEVICPRCAVEFGECECIGTDQLTDEHGYPDVVCAGFPCQPFSRLGRQEKESDSRWLWPETRRVLSELRPRVGILENPTGILDGGLASIIGDLSTMGYDAEWGCIPANWLGAPHIRERIWIVAYLHGKRLEGHAGNGKIFGQEEPDGSTRPAYLCGRIDRSPWWNAEPRIQRVAHGIPDRVDRLKAIGNAVVPQVVEWIGRRIIALEDGATL